MSTRARETLFDMLCHRADLGGVQDKHVLDGFCGSGALGLEALSRGCRSVTFIDNDRYALRTAHANIATLGVEGQTSVMRRDITALGKGAEPSQLVFLSPPWRGTITVARLIAKTLLALQRGGWLANGALIVIENTKQAKAQQDYDEPWHIITTRLCGDHAFTFVRYGG